MPPQHRNEPCDGCNVKDEVAELLKLSREVHAALYGLEKQPEVGLIHRVGKLEEYRQKLERNQYLQLGFMAGAGIAGGGIGSMLTKFVL